MTGIMDFILIEIYHMSVSASPLPQRPWITLNQSDSNRPSGKSHTPSSCFFTVLNSGRIILVCPILSYCIASLLRWTYTAVVTNSNLFKKFPYSIVFVQW